MHDVASRIPHFIKPEETFDLSGHFKYTSAVLDTIGSLPINACHPASGWAQTSVPPGHAPAFDLLLSNGAKRLMRDGLKRGLNWFARQATAGQKAVVVFYEREVC